MSGPVAGSLVKGMNPRRGKDRPAASPRKKKRGTGWLSCHLGLSALGAGVGGHTTFAYL